MSFLALLFAMEKLRYGDLLKMYNSFLRMVKELLQTLVSRLFSQGIVRVEAQICTENTNSVQLFESLGFEREGILRKNFLIEGILYDSYMYAMFAK